MPNISETSVSDISLSPAWSVMIIFPSRGSLSGSVSGPPSQRDDMKSPGRSGKRLGRTARPVARLATVKDLSREATVGGREQQQELNSQDQLGRRNP
jgi:hypothetical protein